MSKTKVFMVNDRPVTYDKDKTYVDLTLYGYGGSVSLDCWVGEKNKAKAIKEFSKLRDLIDTLINDIETMECNEYE